MNWLLATIIGLSFSVRTPNDDTKPLDYEIAVKSAKEAGNFQYFVKKIGNENWVKNTLIHKLIYHKQ